MATRRWNVVVVGSPDEGKSTLINTLLCQRVGIRTVKMKYLDGEASQAPLVVKLTHAPTVVETAQALDTVVFWDSEGFTGSRIHDENLQDQLRAVTDPDLVLVCYSFASNSGRYLPMLHKEIVTKLLEVWGERVVEKLVFVLTKSDIASEAYQVQAAAGGQPTAETRRDGNTQFWESVRLWKSEFVRDQSQSVGRCPVVNTGRIDIAGITQPVSLSFVGGSKEWFHKLCDGIATVNLALYSRFRKGFQLALENNPQLRESYKEDFNEATPPPSSFSLAKRQSRSSVTVKAAVSTIFGLTVCIYRPGSHETLAYLVAAGAFGYALYQVYLELMKKSRKSDQGQFSNA